MVDIAVRGGTVVDGTGAQARRADVGIQGGRICAIGEVGPAERDVDASGLVVAPGFIDVHSHFDAQVFWDPALTPSSLHGVTTTVAGNCGFTLAPWDEASSDYLVRMLSVVEGMPLAALRAGVPGGWTSTSEYLNRIDGTTAVNIGFMVGHSAMRRVVMGADAVGRHATAGEVASMQALLAAGLAAGGLGFSSSWGDAHVDADGDPVPSRAADRGELLALAGVCRSFAGTSIEFIPSLVHGFSEETLDLLPALSLAASRPLNWNLLRISAARRDDAERYLAAGSRARARGAKVVALTMPLPSRIRFSLRTGFALDVLPDWKPFLALAPAERLRALGDPVVRARLRAGADRAPAQIADMADWGSKIITETFDPALKAFEGRSVGEVARAEDKDPFDALMDIVSADDLRTTFSRPFVDLSREDWEANVEAWRDGRAMIGASDAGAHLDFTANFDYQVYVLEEGVRRHGAFGLEEAIHLMTDVPARLYGMVDRGRLVEGAHGDLVAFDPERVGRGELVTRCDLPGGAGRLYAEPRGIAHVLVEGEPIVADGALTGARPGRVLRSGRDTKTPSLA